MTHLYLIRHGDYIGEAHGKLVDHGLSPLGVKQAELLCDRLAATGEIQADVLISSTLPRAQHTAEIIAPALGLPVASDPEFEEWRNEDGSLSEEQFLTMWKEVPREQRPYFRWLPTGENWVEFNLRATSALQRVMHEYAEKTIVLVCHGGIVQASFTYFFGMTIHHLQRADIDTDYTAITHWQVFAREVGWQPNFLLERYNDRHHLEGVDLSVSAEKRDPGWDGRASQ
ncbi:phosphoglycerate mutase [Dictyobacter sp. S3.2.2.5]|uniref:Phosphoglycerate mutase n=1 Tax=Dictyobacter halimunensis TaxID=3026934 RepID=A0ABQ6FZV9_9CHLR|nr:phosphoglycerate mutase [Dictyobacter sp. S3.2.2.5]